MNFIDNKITIHFVHRNLAYLIFILICLLTWRMYAVISPPPLFNKIKAFPLILVILQVVLGIFSLVTSPGIVPNLWGAFEWLAQLHQVTGMLLALSLTGLFYIVRRR